MASKANRVGCLAATVRSLRAVVGALDLVVARYMDTSPAFAHEAAQRVTSERRRLEAAEEQYADAIGLTVEEVRQC